MTTANCPRCSEQVSVPDSASREATVRCPFCQEEYLLGDALDQLPPSLIVVSDFGETPASIVADEDDSPWSALSLDDDDGSEVALSPIDDPSPAAAFDISSGPATAGGKSKAAIRPSSRSRKPKGSPIKSVLSIVIGGLMAFPIAQLILWYLPGDWKRDFGAGPIVAQYVPQIVPVKFRGSQADAESNLEPASPDSSAVIPDFNLGGGQFAETANNGNANNQKSNNPKKKQKTNNTAAVTEQPAAEEQFPAEDMAIDDEGLFGSPLEVPAIELGAFPLLDAPASPSELPSAITKTTEEPATASPTPDAAPLATSNVRNAPEVGAGDVVRSVEAASSSNLAWDTDEANGPSQAIKFDFYLSFSKLGEALTFADRADGEVAAQTAIAAKLLQEVAGQPDKLAAIESVASRWIKWSHEKRTTHGICLAGIVKSVEPVGGFFETTVESDGQQLAVVSTSDPAEYFAADRQVLILGTILADPANDLDGYEGSRELVVLDGFHINIPGE